MDIYRYTTAIIFYGNRIIFINGYMNSITMSSQSLVDRVINYLVDKVVKPFNAPMLC